MRFRGLAGPGAEILRGEGFSAFMSKAYSAIKCEIDAFEERAIELRGVQSFFG